MFLHGAAFKLKSNCMDNTPITPQDNFLIAQFNGQFFKVIRIERGMVDMISGGGHFFTVSYDECKVMTRREFLMDAGFKELYAKIAEQTEQDPTLHNPHGIFWLDQIKESIDIILNYK